MNKALDSKLRLGELIGQHVPRNMVDPAIIENAIQTQAALVIANESGLDAGKKVFERIRPLEQIITELDQHGVADAEVSIKDMAEHLIGDMVIPSDVPSFGDILGKSLPFEVKDALLAAQAAARIDEALQGQNFAAPRIGEKDPAFLKDAQTSLQAILTAHEIGTEISQEDKTQFQAAAGRAIDGANQIWQSRFGLDLIEKPVLAPKTGNEPGQDWQP